jgi:hypothetical protein
MPTYSHERVASGWTATTSRPLGLRPSPEQPDLNTCCMQSLSVAASARYVALDRSREGA